MRRIGALGALALFLVLLPTRLTRLMEQPWGPLTLPRIPITVLRGTITPRSSLATLLGRSVSPAALDQLVSASRPAYDLARLSVGRPFGLALGPDGLVEAFTYGIDELRMLRVLRHGDALTAEVVERDYETRVSLTTGVIRSSLFTAVTAAGEQDQLALDLAEIFAWDVDFNTELQKGDSFSVAVEKMFVGGRFSRYGRIQAAEFRRGSRRLLAVRFDDGRGGGYYAPDGTPLRKAFLRSPLKFSRITSGFTGKRFHPILRQFTAHLGIDYAAPEGTPALASAGGTVGVAGWIDGFGNAVRLRHANGYETLYGHLSRVNVRVGERVAQGETIGAVGSTGLSTGPHLHYAMLRNGAWVNPLTVELPPAEPIAPEERGAFATARDAALARLLPGPERDDGAPLAAAPSP